MSFAVVRLAIIVGPKPLAKADHPCNKLQGILAKPNKIKIIHLNPGFSPVL